MVLLVKPQFEAGRAEVSKGKGVITDPDVHERVRDEVGAALVDAGCEVDGLDRVADRVAPTATSSTSSTPSAPLAAAEGAP